MLLCLPLVLLLLLGALYTFPLSSKKGVQMSTAMKKEVLSSMPEEVVSSQKQIIISWFSLVLLVNLFSLFSHFFSGTALLSMTLVLAVSGWMGTVFPKAAFLSEQLLKGLTPGGTPLPLMSFMVLIEFVSQTIRPITLMVRLAVNLMTGHLILALMAFPGSVSFISQFIFFLLEMMVALVQAYVFSLLLTLYLNE